MPQVFNLPVYIPIYIYSKLVSVYEFNFLNLLQLNLFSVKFTIIESLILSYINFDK